MRPSRERTPRRARQSERQEDTVELLWTLGMNAEGIELALRELITDKRIPDLRAVTPAQMTEVEDGIRRQYLHTQRLTKIRVLLEQSAEMQKFLGLDSSRYQKWIAASVSRRRLRMMPLWASLEH